MKRCPECRRDYYDDTLVFCLDDGAHLIDGGEPKQLTNFTSDLIQSFDFSRDGKQIAFTKRTGTSDVVLITGFRK